MNRRFALKLFAAAPAAAAALVAPRALSDTEAAAFKERWEAAGLDRPDPEVLKVEPPMEYIGDVDRIVLNPGDTVVLSVDRTLDDDTAGRMREYLERVFPGHRCLVLSEGLKLGVVGKG